MYLVYIKPTLFIFQDLNVVEGVSSGIASVISDYTQQMPPVLSSSNLGQLRKVVKLIGEPWSDMEACEKITMRTEMSTESGRNKNNPNHYASNNLG